MNFTFLPRRLMLARIVFSAAALFIFMFAYGGPLSSVAALADEPSPAEVGPVPPGGLSRLGKGAINRVIISPDERRLAVSTHVGVYMYDVPTMRQMWYSEGYDLIFVPIAFSPDSTQLVGGHNKDRLAAWNVETGEIVAHYDYEYGVFDAAFSGDGRYVVGTSGGEALAWDAATGNLIYWKNDYHTLLADLVTASPDGTMFATAGMMYDTHDEIAVWDTATGAVRHTFKVALPVKAPSVTALRFTPDNKYLVVGFEKGWVVGWDLEKGTPTYSFRVPDGFVADISFSPDSNLMAIGAAHVYVYHTRSGALAHSYSQLPASTYGPWFGADGKLKSLAVSNSIVTIIDVESGAELARMDGHLSADKSAAMTPDGLTLILGKYGGRLEVRDVASKAVKMNLKGPYTADSLAVSPDSSIVAGVFRYNLDDIITKVRAWDLTTGRELYTLSDNDNSIGDVQFSPDGATLLIGFGDGAIRRVDARTGETLTNYTDFVKEKARVILAPDGQTVTLISNDHITQWDLSSGSQVKDIPIDLAGSTYSLPGTASFSADGVLLAAEGSRFLDGAVVYLWNIQTGQLIARIDDGLHHGAFGSVESIAFSRDDSLMAVGIEDGTILLVDTRSGQLARVLQGHGAEVSWLQFLPQTGQLVSASNDGTVVFWQVP